MSITLTTGLKVLRGGSAGFLVPTLELITGLQLVLQSGRLLLSPALADAGLLVREMENFRLKPRLAGGADEATGRERLTSSRETWVQLCAIQRLPRRLKPDLDHPQAEFKYPKKEE